MVGPSRPASSESGDEQQQQPPPPRRTRGRGTRTGKKGSSSSRPPSLARGKAKDLGAVYQASKEREVAGSGRGSGTVGISTSTDGRPPSRRRLAGAGGAGRRGKEPVEEETETGRAEEETESGRAEEEDDGLPPADGPDRTEDEEAEQEGQAEVTSVYLRGLVHLPKTVPATSRPVITPEGSG